MDTEEVTVENLTETLQTGILGNPREDAVMNADWIKENGPLTLTIKGFVKRRYTKGTNVDTVWIMLFEEDVPGVRLNLENQSKLFEVMGTAQIDQIVSRKIVAYYEPSVKMGSKKTGGVRLERAEDLAGA
jgi:hypothetical protein